MFAFYQRAIATRMKLPELQLGFFRGVVIDDQHGVYVYARDLGDQHAYIVLNRSSKERTIEVPIDLANGTKLINYLDPKQADLKESENDRPVIEVKSDAHLAAVNGGKFTITLKPFTTAVLTSSK
jgi:hypothetical protein